MTKDDARREALGRWRELDVMKRQSHKQAHAFAEVLLPLLEFHTVANKRRLIEAWLIRDISEREAAVVAVEAKLGAGKSVAP